MSRLYLIILNILTISTTFYLYKYYTNKINKMQTECKEEAFERIWHERYKNYYAPPYIDINKSTIKFKF